MARTLLIEELLIHLRVPRGLPERAYTAMRRTLMGTPFIADLRRTVRGVIRQYPSLSKARATVTR